MRKTIVKKPKKKQTKIDIGRVVRDLRQNLGMTTTELAKKVGISQAQVSRLENNEQGFRSSVVTRIAHALRVKPWVLFMTDDERGAASKMLGLAI